MKIHLKPRSEKLSPRNPWGLSHPPLYHQLRTFEALQTYDLVVNTYNTGTGKTIASLLHLFTLNGTGTNVLFIAPTNALLAQHAEDIAEFVASHHLDFQVLQVNAEEVRALRLAQTPEATPTRPGELLQRLIRNYLEFEAEATRRRPIILVVNPDIFYYALYFRYAAHDQRNLFERFLTAFDYIVVDEFHYYDSKQLSNFLFAFALFEQFGYFEIKSRKVCLLSATPTDEVLTYLDRLFGKRWVLISPGNEPAESQHLPEIPVLTPLELTIEADEFEKWVEEHRNDLARWVADDDLDGALISDSLWRVNTAYALLRDILAPTRMGRITGPEPPQARAQATARDLILATPTVDIGYNFKKMGKKRQNLDFVICSARHSDALLQRIGRAGRVLGKPETGHPSKAVALVPQETWQRLQTYDAQVMSRSDFAHLIRQEAGLPPKHSLMQYIRTHAIVESFWPIYQIRKVMPPEEESEVEALFERVRAVFAPQSRRSFKGLRWFFRKLESRERWLRRSRDGDFPLDLQTAEMCADWIAWLDPAQGHIQPRDLLPHLSRLCQGSSQEKLRAFIQSQVVVTRALFAFRDSFQGPIAVFHDPQHLFSSEAINAYDLLHLLSYYQLSPPMSRRQFEALAGITTLRGRFYVRLLRPRSAPILLALVYESDEDQKAFERRWCGAPVALQGIRLQAWLRKQGAVAGGLDQRYVEALKQEYIPMLIVPPDLVGAMISRLRSTDLWARRLIVRFPDGTVEEDYRAILGTGAFHAHAALQGHYLARKKLKVEAIIL